MFSFCSQFVLELPTGLLDYHKGSLILGDGIESVDSRASWTVAERAWNQFMGHFRVQSQKHFGAQSQGPKLPHALSDACRGKTSLGAFAYGAGSIQLPQRDFLKIFLKFYLFIFWLHCVFVAVWGLSLAVVSGSYSLDAVHGLLVEVVSPVV